MELRGARRRKLEGFVYAVALVLALVVGYYGLRRALVAYAPGARLEHPPAEPERELPGSPMEQSVSELPPMRILRTGSLRRSSPVVPSPVRKKDSSGESAAER